MGVDFIEGRMELYLKDGHNDYYGVSQRSEV